MMATHSATPVGGGLQTLLRQAHSFNCPSVAASRRRRAAAIVSAAASPSSAPETGTSSSSSSGASSGPVVQAKSTLSAIYGNEVQVKHIDFAQRRREREIREIIEAGRRAGFKDEALMRERLQKLEFLVPELAPNLDRMKASDWVRLVSEDTNTIAMRIIAIKTLYPRASISRIVTVAPRTLFKDVKQLQEEAAQVQLMLATAPDPDAIIEAVPYLMDPSALTLALSNISRWYNTKTPVDVLQTNPKLLLNVDEADLEADPLYGLDLCIELPLFTSKEAYRAFVAEQARLQAAGDL